MDKPARDARLDREARKAASKYDFVKVKVWLGEERCHYYVLSRFLVSRSLTVTKMPHLKAVKIALELKKFCVDNGMLDISQAQMEEVLLQIMQSRGFGDMYVRRYKMVTRFHLQRRPLVIFISGSACTGKSTLAQQLAARLNLPNVLQTDIIYQLLQASPAAPLNPAPLWRRADLSTAEVLAEYHQECGVVRRGIDADLGKCVRDGKSFIIEGLHLDPGRYLYEFGRHGVSQLQPATLSSYPSAAETLPCLGEAVLDTAAKQTAQMAGAQQPAMRVPKSPTAGWASSVTASTAGSATGSAAGYSMEAGQVPRMAPDQQQKSPSASPPRSGRRSSGETPHASTRQRIRERLRRLPGRSSSVNGESLALLSALPPAAGPASPAKQSRRAASAVSGPSQRVLFALRQDARGDADGREDSGGLRPRLAPWPAAKALLESLRPLASEGHQAVDTALAKLHLRHEGSAGGGRTRGDSLQAKDQQQQTRQHSGADSSQQHAGAMSAQPNMQSGTSGEQPKSSNDSMSRAADPAEEGDGSACRPFKSVRFSDVGEACPAFDAAADATAGTPPDADAQLGPVFVPIVLTMDEAEHAPLLEEWLARQQVQSGPGCCSDEEALARVRLLQDHFCTYQARAVPVVRISTANLTRTLDGLHDYLLQCMELAMNDGA